MLYDHDISVLGVGESWLLPSIPSSVVAIPNYSIVRRDVEGSIPKHGVCIYVRSSINFVEISTDIKNLLVIHLFDLDIYVVYVYRPPSYSFLDNHYLLDFIYNFCSNKEIILMGDFNLPSIKWNHEFPGVGLSLTDSLFYESFISLGLTQLITESTYFPSGNILDIILISDSERFGEATVLPPFPSCGHSPVMISYLFQRTIGCDSNSQTIKLWRHGRYGSICECLRDIDWDFEFTYLNPDQMYTRFLDIVDPLIDRYVPSKCFSSSSVPPWLVKPPRALKTQRSHLWEEYKLQRHEYGRQSPRALAVLSRFLDANYQLRNFSITKQSQYESSIAELLISNCKVFHAYIRGKKINPPSIGPLRSPTGEIIHDPRAMSELFAASFASVYTSANPDSPFPHQVFHGGIGEIDISVDDVIAAVNQLDGSSSMGPDGIHPFFLKSCISELAYPLYKIFCTSLLFGVLPSAWKGSLVAPIYKKGSRYDPLNYRPISLTSVCAKSMERIITKFIYDYLESNGILTNDQFGFRQGRSTEDQLIVTYNSVSQWLDQGFAVDLVLFDFSKAFDVVCHDILITKLYSLGIRGNLLNWIRDFLHDRRMRVVVNHHLSDSRTVESGVPQGSVMGPLLFLLYINFITSGVLSPTKIFADDLKMYVNIRFDVEVNTVRDLAACQSDINNLVGVAKSWGLSMNSDKCVLLRFCRRPILWENIDHTGQYLLDGSPIPMKDSASDLGVLIDTSLKFHQHIANIVHKAGGLSCSILKATVNRDASFMVPLYISHIRPILEYASSVWNTGYIADLQLLESVQRRWTKNIRGLEHLDYSVRLRTLNLFSVKGRLLRHDLINYWKIFHGHSPLSPSDLFPPPNHPGTRGHQFKIAHTRSQLEMRKRFFNMRWVVVWNSLPGSVVSVTSLASFKVALSRHLGDILFDYN